MSVWSGQAKLKGGAGPALAYYQEVADDGVSAVLGYYANEEDGVVFSRIGGRAREHLPGLGLEMTRRQFTDAWNYKWDGVKLGREGLAPVQARDAEGNPVFEQIPVMGPDGEQLTNADGSPKFRQGDKVWVMVDKTKKERIPGTNEWVDKPVMDSATGKPKQKKLMVADPVKGHDITFAFGKDAAEFVIAHPEHTDVVKQAALEAVELTMQWVERTTKLVTEPTPDGGKRLTESDGLLWATTLGFVARPTPDSESRKVSVNGQEVSVGPDAHFHAQVLLFSAARTREGEWHKVDGKQLWQTAKERGQYCSTQFNRLLEEAGIKISYTEHPDRKGQFVSQIEGSNEAIRDNHSTNKHRRWLIEDQYERETGLRSNEKVVRERMAKTKGSKTKAAKEADKVGNTEQLKRWGEWHKQRGFEETIADRGERIDHGSWEDRRAVFFERMESPEGVAKDIQSAAVFGPETISEAAYRMAEGLGFKPVEIDDLMTLYRDKLIVRRDAKKEDARYFTTPTIMASEAETADLFELLAATPTTTASPENVTAGARSLDISLDAEQLRAHEAMCSGVRVVHINGRAGAGKTATVRASVDTLRRAGQVDEVIVVAVQAKRAKETGEKLKADNAWSTVKLQERIDKGWEPTHKTLVVFDEVAMANTFQMASVLRNVGPARLVTIGDDKQSAAIGAAGWYEKELQARGFMELTVNHRQADHRDVRAFELLREGDAEAMVQDFADRKLIKVADTRDELPKLIVGRWEHYREKNYSSDEIAIIHTGSSVDLDSVNRFVQRKRIERGEIDEGQQFTVSEQNGRHWTLYSGDRIVFNDGYAFTDWTMEPILNGTMGSIVRMSDNGQCRIELDTEDRRTVTIQLTKEAVRQKVAPAYVMSTNKFQGGEVAINLVVPGTPEIASLQSGYSQVTRGVVRTEILLDRDTWGTYPAQSLGVAWSQELRKMQASEFMALDAEYEEMLEDDELDLVVSSAEQAREHLGDIRDGLNGGISY